MAFCGPPFGRCAELEDENFVHSLLTRIQAENLLPMSFQSSLGLLRVRIAMIRND